MQTRALYPQNNVWPGHLRPYETVPIRIKTISSASEGGRKPQGENHQTLAVKGERHPTCGTESNPGSSSSQDSNPGLNGERRTCLNGTTKPLIQLNKIYKNFGDFIKDWIQIAFLPLSHSNHYITMFSVLVWGCNWILFMHGRFCPVRLIHRIRRISLHFDKKLIGLNLWRVIVCFVACAYRIYVQKYEIEKKVTSLPDESIHNPI